MREVGVTPDAWEAKATPRSSRGLGDWRLGRSAGGYQTQAHRVADLRTLPERWTPGTQLKETRNGRASPDHPRPHGPRGHDAWLRRDGATRRPAWSTDLQ